MESARTLDDAPTPAAVVDMDRLEANLDRMAAYTSAHGFALRPHTKTHKTPEMAAEQLRRGAVGVTVATAHEAEVMASVTDDILIAYPPVDRDRIERILALPPSVRVTVALDSHEALGRLHAAARPHDRDIGVLVEADLGMKRVGVQTPEQAVALAKAIEAPLVFRGLMVYPGHIRMHVREQAEALAALGRDVLRFRDALTAEGLAPEVVSAGSTPTAWASHEIAGLTEIRPGTYIFNDRTTYGMGACEWEHCAYSILATVVSTAVPGQAVVDAGAKALCKEEIRAAGLTGYGALVDRPDVVVSSMSEEHGILDLSRTDWRPRIGERVRIVPNHVCVSVNLHPRLWYERGGRVERVLPVVARGWS